MAETVVFIRIVLQIKLTYCVRVNIAHGHIHWYLVVFDCQTQTDPPKGISAKTTHCKVKCLNFNYNLAYVLLCTRDHVVKTCNETMASIIHMLSQNVESTKFVMPVRRDNVLVDALCSTKRSTFSPSLTLSVCQFLVYMHTYNISKITTRQRVLLVSESSFILSVPGAVFGRGR